MSIPPGLEVLESPDDLLAEEKTNLVEIVAQLLRCNADPQDRETVEQTIKQQMSIFLQRVFQNWTSDDPVNANPTIPRRSETRIEVGTFSSNLPQSADKERKRKRGEETIIQPHRMAGAPAYISPLLSYGGMTITHRWVDSKSQMVNRRFIRLHDGMTYVKAMGEACARYDAIESERVQNFNFNLARTIARRRISKWAKKPHSQRRYPDIALEDHVEGFVEMELCRHVAQTMVDYAVVVRDRLMRGGNSNWQM